MGTMVSIVHIIFINFADSQLRGVYGSLNSINLKYYIKQYLESLKGRALYLTCIILSQMFSKEGKILYSEYGPPFISNIIIMRLDRYEF